MLKISLAMDGDAFEVDILENDRGFWELRNNPDALEVGCFHLIGFDGENTITVHVSGMQDGTHSIAVVHNVVDNPIVVVQAEAPRRLATDDSYWAQAERVVNELLAQVCDYPEELPCAM